MEDIGLGKKPPKSFAEKPSVKKPPAPPVKDDSEKGGGLLDEAIEAMKERHKKANEYAKGGAVRGDGCCVKGKTKGRFR